jgi:hypothetical protein
MRVAQQVNLFVLTPPAGETREAEKAAAPPSLPPAPIVTPLISIRADGSNASISPLLALGGRVQFSNLPWPVQTMPGLAMPGSSMPGASLSGLGKPGSIAGSIAGSIPGFPIRTGLRAAPQTAPPASQPPAPLLAQPEVKSRWKSALGMWTGSTTVLHFVPGMSQDQITHAVATAGVFSPGQTNSIAETVARLLNGHFGEALRVGVTCGGILGALAVFFGYEKYAVHAIVGGTILVGSLVLVLNRGSNHLAGNWKLNAMETTYQAGTLPRQETESLTEYGGEVKISRVSIAEGGKRDVLTYHVKADGQAHRSDRNGASSGVSNGASNGQLVVASMKDDMLDLAYSENGQVVARETRTVSADGRKMTVTTSGRGPGGDPFQNVEVFDRE